MEGKPFPYYHADEEVCERQVARVAAIKQRSQGDVLHGHIDSDQFAGAREGFGEGAFESEKYGDFSILGGPCSRPLRQFEGRCAESRMQAAKQGLQGLT